MADLPPVWDARTSKAREFFSARVLGPLVIATRPHDLRTPSAIADAATAWILCLKDVPPDVLLRGVESLLAQGPKWMPRPGDLREACAAEIAGLRRDAAARGAAVIAECEACHGSTWRERADGRVERCDCHAHALRLQDGLPQPLALPPAEREDGAA